ncbi:hypothetical protein HPS174_0512 [Glaesserella parasuis 174]|nr:hypothetical protein HPS174_0512 [Glaesserella parasuis 174]
MSVFRFFENLSDPRAYNQKHHFLDIVFLVVSAVISGKLRNCSHRFTYGLGRGLR